MLNKKILTQLLLVIGLSGQVFGADEPPKQSTIEKVEQASEEVKQAARKCINTGDCMTISLLNCTNNFLCYNNCEIGHDPQAVNRSNMLAVLGFFGLGDIPMEGNAVIGCRQGCAARSISDCNDVIPGCTPEDTPKCLKPKEQPTDYRFIPATADPARICREYCGAVPEWPGSKDRQFCENRCRVLDQLSDCFKRNKGAPDILKLCGYEGKETGGSDATWSKDSLVAVKLNSFVQEATCVFDQEAGRPDSDTCKYLCQDKTGVAKAQDSWLRTCNTRGMTQMEADRNRQKEVQKALINAVGAAMQSAGEGKVAVYSAREALEGTQKETAENLADWEAQQKREREQAEKELAEEQK